jgi:thioester reductase-like protein
VLRDLLLQNDRAIVHCLVRAESPAQGLERIRAALRSAEIWDEDYAVRLQVWPGDICRPHLGLTDEDFDRLCDEIDAVYHLAADLTLLGSYLAMREANTRSVAGILELALRRRTKHLFYASTMGVFPQYFCNFANEFSDRGINDEAQPDLATMKSIFPPELVGYPWSKLVVEQSLLFGRNLGLPTAIMRLPQTGVAASTGHIQRNDIKVRILMAVLDVGLVPSGFTLRWTEPVDTVSELLTTISRNPARRHCIYHLVNPTPSNHGLELADFGLQARECSYQEFRRACQARGPRSPLSGHWPLIDHFAGYWFAPDDGASAGARHAPPTTNGTVMIDAPRHPAWPGLITIMSRSLGWITRHEKTWPYHRPSVSLDGASLVRRAEHFAKRLDVPFDDAYPPALLAGLDRLISALRAPTARIRQDRLPAITFELGRKLWNRAALTSEYLRFSAIARESLERPVFVLGINRTGTTFLHRLLAQSERFWAVYPHELAHTALPLDERQEARHDSTDDLLAASGVVGAMRGIHAVEAGEPEEDFAFLEQSFASWTYPLRYHVPDYAQWLAGQPGDFAYRGHSRALQHLSWQRGTRLGAPSRQWLLKMPFHLAELETLVTTYPDAVFIQTHRDPQEFMPSWLSLAESVRSLAAHSPDRAALGLEQLEFLSRMLEDAMRFRAANPHLEHRFVDVSYLDLVLDPIGTVQEIYRRSGWTLDDTSRKATIRRQAEQAVRRSTESRHRYSLQTYGLTSDQVETSFEHYTQFVRRNGIRMR